MIDLRALWLETFYEKLKGDNANNAAEHARDAVQKVKEFQAEGLFDYQDPPDPVP